jgi:hypothetical protein
MCKARWLECEARSRKYGKTWWGNAWVEAMERINHNTNRLPRGRSYANGGRVSEINIDVSGRVRAGVRGTRPTPYRIEIKLKEFSRQTRLVNRFAGVKPDAGDKTARCIFKIISTPAPTPSTPYPFLP